MTKEDDGSYKAIVTTIATSNGETSISYENFTGTEAEVTANIKALKTINVTYDSSTAHVQVVEDGVIIN